MEHLRIIPHRASAEVAAAAPTAMLVHDDAREWGSDRYLSITMYSKTSGNARGNASDAADARCGYTLNNEGKRTRRRISFLVCAVALLNLNSKLNSHATISKRLHFHIRFRSAKMSLEGLFTRNIFSPSKLLPPLLNVFFYCHQNIREKMGS